ncbi:uncharacterized protein K452DRAFT_145900 [Aplosporella prunicola CBS 121167]|uniref:Uncharacterized protein n=1 Tax=Aplosporella prunicola CBS 121167 TaxID=1176127 RepID=A0A6A6BKR9_9PEZI|nr:uncharacterized protein K452DRAFT_145900 [Aplosporella prunicola CBS 121167]KAF2144722.1 hypothetical protein K452DRAFT_145900 [Aplosporella prunicola CBS 121167]
MLCRSVRLSVFFSLSHPSISLKLVHYTIVSKSHNPTRACPTMSDPLSVASSAVGIVSLGLQVCQGLTSYYQAWREYDVGLNQAATSAKELTDSLALLQTTLQKLCSAPDVMSHAEKSIASCENGIRNLEMRLHECRRTPIPTSSAEKFQQLAQRSLYPFRKKTVDGLKAVVAELQGNVTAAVQVVQLDVLGEIKEGTSDSKTSSAAAAADISLARATLEAFRAESTPRLQSLPNIEQGVQTIGSGVTSMSASLDSVAMNTVESKAELTRILPIIEASSARIPAAEQTLVARFDKQGQQNAETQRQLLRQNAETQRLLMRFIAKPSLLEETCNDAASRGLLTKTDVFSDPGLLNQAAYRMRPLRRCSCRRKIPIKPNIPRDHFVYPFYEESSQHEKCCPLWASSERSKRLGLRISHYRNILARAVEISISITHGAGGLSISPLLRLGRFRRPDSPAFEPFYYYLGGPSTGSEQKRLIWNFRRKECRPASFGTVWTAKLLEIQRLFESGKASPTDVNNEGFNVLHVACIAFASMFGSGAYDCHYDFEEIMTAGRILLRLMELGVPASEVCDDNMTPLFYLLHEPISGLNCYSSPFPENTVTLLTGVETFFEEAEIMFGDHRGPFNPEWLLLPLNFRSRIAESFDCGKLSMAVIVRSEEAVRACLHANPRSVNERSSRGHTPLHMAIPWPRGVALLVEAGADVHALDYSNYSVLHYSFRLGCVESAALIFSAGCEMPLGLRSIPMDLRKWSPVIAKALVGRRNYLSHLAINHLPQEFIKEFSLDESRLPDAHAGRVIETLEAYGVNIPSSIRSSMIFHTPIYAYNDWFTAEAAELLFKGGFVDINFPDIHGLTPLMKIDWDPPDFLGYLCWLVEKGANMYYTPSDASPPAAHYVAIGVMDYALRFTREDYLAVEGRLNVPLGHLATDSGSRLVLNVLAEDFTDKCVCACSSQGCTTITTMFKPLKPLVNIHRRLIDCLSPILGPNHPYWTRLSPAIIRLSTFQRMELTHTCCRGGRYAYHDWHCCCKFKLPDAAEVAEIREEESELLTQLEELVVEFVDKYNELGVPIVDFLEGYWTDRMEEVLHPIDPPDPEVVQRVKEIGVILDP